ncbi:MAG: hypothetical protein HYZ17_09325 [Betaproteobacteria bacterium]|nr:hypothetical protein [Betaproteobacteria bacterium]
MARPTPLLGAFLLLLAVVMASACGFRLRGDASLPFRTVFISGGQGTPLYPELARRLRGDAGARLVEAADQAEAIIEVAMFNFDKQVLTISGGGRVREFLLTLRIVFRVHDGKGGEWLKSGEISIKRDFSFNDSQALAKEAEERALVQTMYTDALDQIMRRLASARRPGA